MPLSPSNIRNLRNNINGENTRGIFVCTRPISLATKRYSALLYLEALPREMHPGTFFAIATDFPETVKEAVELCVNATVRFLVEWEIRNEKYNLKPDDKKPWSKK